MSESCVLRCLVPPSCVLRCLVPPLVCLSRVCYVASLPPRVSESCVLRCLVPLLSVCLVVCVTLTHSPVVCLVVCVTLTRSSVVCLPVLCVCVRIHNYVTQTVLAVNPRDLINPLTSFTIPFFFLSPTLSLLPPSFSLSFMPLLPS